MRKKLKDIAKELNLSVSTVSRVVNDRDRVDPETRKRVQQLLKRYDYKPNEVARSLRLRDVKTIAIVVPDISNSFYASVIKGAQSVSRKNEYSIMVCNSDENIELEEEALQLVLQKRIAGLILSSVGDSTKMVQRLRDEGVVVVFTDNLPSQTFNCDSVSINNIAAAYKLTRKLIDDGYRKIGFISGPSAQSSGSERLSGFKQAIIDKGLSLEDDWILEGDFKANSGRENMERILKLDKRPEAVIIANNYMAYGAISVLRQAGLKIPQDMAVAAFDAKDETGLIVPCITSVNQPSFEIGQISAEIIIRRLENVNKRMFENIILEPEFQDGESC